MNRQVIRMGLIFVTLAGPATSVAQSLGTAFTYQGQLKFNGAPATGTYDLQFRLYDASTGGTPLATTCIDGVAPSGGLFTVTLDFGQQFNGDARWLEISVRADATSGNCGVGSYTATLSPRQPLTPAPHALALPGLLTQQNATSPNVIGGRNDNTVSAGAVGATISGGGAGGVTNNRVSDNYATVGGGSDNQAGNNNANFTDAFYATVGGGVSNTATSSYTTIAGGRNNMVSQSHGAVGGGRNNSVTAQYGTIAGGGPSNTADVNGTRNRVTDQYGTIAGGGNNQAGDNAGTTTDRQYATVAGGEGNVASGTHSTVAGGLMNTAAGTGAFAAGRQATSGHDGSFVWSDGTAPFASTAANQFLVQATGGVGIGTATPASSLHIFGNQPALRLQDDDNGGSSMEMYDAGPTQFVFNKFSALAPEALIDINPRPLDGTSTAAVRFFRATSTTGSKNVHFLRGNNTTQISATIGVDGANSYFQAHGGNVGIGTAAPSSKLHVSAGDVMIDDAGSAPVVACRRANGTIGSPSAVLANDYLASFEGLGFNGTSYTGARGWLSIQAAENWSPTAQGTFLSLANTPTGSTTSVERMRITANGGVGIGTTNPQSKLHIGGGDVLADDYGTWASVECRRANGTMAAPTAVTTDDQLAVFGGAGHDGTSFATEAWMSMHAAELWTPTAHGAYLKFITTGIGSLNSPERMRIAANGNVGIGTPDPQTKAHVLGNGRTLALEGTDHTYVEFYPDGYAAGRKGWLGYGAPTDNNLTIRNDIAGANIVLTPGTGGVVSVPVLQILGADVAEKFPVSDKVEPGMVVEIDPDHPGQLRLCREAYSRRVAGIVSGAGNLPAGAVLGNLPGHETAPPIALSGRVWCWCDASSDPIEPGDLMTTSELPGHAMKVAGSRQAGGAVLGKAMTSLRSGTGLVLVLVSLQ